MTTRRSAGAGWVCRAIGVVMACSSFVHAADNFATGDIAGDSAALTTSNTISLTSQTLLLVKQARNTSGTVLGSGANVTLGQTIYFVLYVDNPTGFAANDVQLTDALVETQFTYVPNSLEITSVPTGSNDATIWAGPWSAVSDAVGGPDDVASITDSGGPADLDNVTVGAVSGQANTTLNVPASTLWAIRFQVTVD